MNPYQFPVCCEVCGGKAVGTSEYVAAEWSADSFVFHRNPQVCAEILKYKREELKRRECELRERELYMPELRKLDIQRRIMSATGQRSLYH